MRNAARGFAWLLGLAMAGLCILTPFGPGGLQRAEATHIGCGDSFTSGVNTLDSNVTGCTSTAITLTGPAILHLNGRTISCKSIGGVDGVVLLGRQATLLGPGLVTGCDEDVVLSEDGYHYVQNVTATHSAGGGFLVESSYNTLVGNTAKDNLDSGFKVEAAGIDPADDLVQGNVLIMNTATRSEHHGFHINGRANRLWNNRSFQNFDNGFDVEKGKENILDANQAWANTDDGFEAGDGGDRNIFIHNTSTGNGVGSGDHHDGDGIKIEGDGNVVMFNTTTGNLRNGIHTECCNDPLNVEDALDNYIAKNTAKNNRLGDLQDDAVGCATNTWVTNTFGTRNQSCIH